MFATVEEAEKAAAILRRFARVQAFAGVIPLTGEVTIQVNKLPEMEFIGERNSWEEVAALIEERNPVQADRRVGQLAVAREHLKAAKDRLGWGRDATDREVIVDLAYAIEALLEVLA
jgi:hypothetical protein